ncbi:hypothetical protein BZB76_5060 [Actinomadura pelletieri DSM 43383]|uniref:Uncharacterized protein n=1 Tax=Actinomadura pelletieri DSM 43383 TaxID=1120940 RepID=A0A495QJE4_9ACTN|nr:hypothetical protein [Actinomadura pelletieri]RKS72239.1 hypothetical protein BZB76_5060 [Actinomadura pelletieri DSM 43383]
MFWRKQKAAIERFHPLHRALILERACSVSLRRDDWEPVIQSLARHGAEVRRRRWRLPKRVPGVLVPMLRILAADMPPDGVLSVAADMRGSNVPEKKGPEQHVPTQHPISAMRQWYVVDPWLRIRAELRDGSVVELDVTDRIRNRKYRKNARGKVKLKSKSKTVQIVRVTRRLAKDAVVRPPTAPPPRWIRVRVKRGARMVIRANGKFPGPLEDQAMIDRILHVSTEPFRWTPPGTAARRAR